MIWTVTGGSVFFYCGAFIPKDHRGGAARLDGKRSFVKLALLSSLHCILFGSGSGNTILYFVRLRYEYLLL